MRDTHERRRHISGLIRKKDVKASRELIFEPELYYYSVIIFAEIVNAAKTTCRIIHIICIHNNPVTRVYLNRMRPPKQMGLWVVFRFWNPDATWFPLLRKLVLPYWLLNTYSVGPPSSMPRRPRRTTTYETDARIPHRSCWEVTYASFASLITQIIMCVRQQWKVCIYSVERRGRARRTPTSWRRRKFPERVFVSFIPGQAYLVGQWERKPLFSDVVAAYSVYLLINI